MNVKNIFSTAMGLESYFAPVKPKGVKTNICADCQRHIAHCIWLHKDEPVPGWTAKKSYNKRNFPFAWSYHVTACPLYVPPDPERMAMQEEEMRREAEERRREQDRRWGRMFF